MKDDPFPKSMPRRHATPQEASSPAIQPPAKKDPAYLAFIRSLPCRVPGECEGPTEPHHYPAKGMGGANGDDAKTAPLCTKHHRQWHDHRRFDGLTKAESETIIYSEQVNALLRYLRGHL